MSEAAEMKFVQRIEKGGKTYLYFRKKGEARIELKSAWGSQALQDEVDALAGAVFGAKPLPGTLKGAAVAYELEDADFLALAASTKVLYVGILNELKDDFGDVPVGRFTPEYLLELRNAWASRGHVAANHRLQVLKNLLWPSIIKANNGDPFALIPQARRPANLKEPNPIWPEDVVITTIEAAIAQRKFGLARAVILARWAGPRRSDLVVLTPRALDGGRVSFISGKRKVRVDIAQDPHLVQWLARTPATQPLEARQGRKVKPDSPTRLQPARLVYNLAGAPYTEDGLALELGKLLVELVKAQRIGGAVLNDAGDVVGCEYGLHGLRHTRGVELALSGCSDAEGAAQLGHASPSSFAKYRRQADRTRLADSATDRVVALRERQANGKV
jgi:integrase